MWARWVCLIIAIFCVVVCVILLPTRRPDVQPQVEWRTFTPELAKQAKRMRRPLLVLATGEWKPTSSFGMMRQAFDTRRIRDLVSKHSVIVAHHDVTTNTAARVENLRSLVDLRPDSEWFLYVPLLIFQPNHESKQSFMSRDFSEEALTTNILRMMSDRE